MTYLTYFDHSYATRGIALYQSLLRHEKDFHLIILALDKYVEDAIRGLPFVTPMRLSDLPKEVRDWQASRDYASFCWTISPFAVEWGLRQCDSIFYIDADVFLFSPLDELYREIGGDSIAIAPHRFAEKDRWRELENGIYNVGTVLFSNDNTALACLGDWEEQCAAGRDDQVGWNLLVPKHNVHIIQNLGIDDAPWCANRYDYRQVGDTIMVSDGQREDRLAAWHFHELTHSDSGMITRMTNWFLPPFVVDNIYPRYQEALYDARRFLG